jgi:hypothetical protein
MLVTCQFWCLKMHPQTPEDGHTDPHNWPKNRKMRKKKMKKVIHPWLEGWANGPRLANRGIVLNSGIGWALYSSVTLDLRPTTALLLYQHFTQQSFRPVCIITGSVVTPKVSWNFYEPSCTYISSCDCFFHLLLTPTNPFQIFHVEMLLQYSDCSPCRSRCSRSSGALHQNTTSGSCLNDKDVLSLKANVKTSSHSIKWRVPYSHNLALVGPNVVATCWCCKSGV